ncbi:HNH endonuclease [Roseiconus lacunae]|nr:HNH endonuclease [Roseiconus lacunae]
MRWPAKQVAKQAARRKYTGPNKRQKFEYRCAGCGEWFPDKEVELDHVIPAGKLNSFEDLPGFVERLFCEPDGYQILCKDRCHHAKTHQKGKQAETLFPA